MYKIEFHYRSKVLLIGLNAARFLILKADGVNPSDKFFT